MAAGEYTNSSGTSVNFLEYTSLMVNEKMAEAKKGCGASTSLVKSALLISASSESRLKTCPPANSEYAMGDPRRPPIPYVGTL